MREIVILADLGEKKSSKIFVNIYNILQIAPMNINNRFYNFITI